MRCPTIPVLHQRLVQPLQLSRRDPQGRRGLRHLRLDGRRGLRQRHAVAFPHPAQRRAPHHAGAVGPWRAGQRLAVARRVEPELPVLGEVLRFFDQHLAGRDTGLKDEDPIHYFTVHAEEWRVGHELAAGQGQPAVLHRARPPARGGAAERRHVGAVPGRLHGRQRHADALRAHRRHRRHGVLRRLAGARAPAAGLHHAAA